MDEDGRDAGRSPWRERSFLELLGDMFTHPAALELRRPPAARTGGEGPPLRDARTGGEDPALQDARNIRRCFDLAIESIPELKGARPARRPPEADSRNPLDDLPEELAACERALPGAAERILALAEREQRRRAERAERALDAREKRLDAEEGAPEPIEDEFAAGLERERRRLVPAFLTAMGLLAVAGAAAWRGDVPVALGVALACALIPVLPPAGRLAARLLGRRSGGPPRTPPDR